MGFSDLTSFIVSNILAVVIPIFIYIPFLFPLNYIYNFFSIYYPDCFKVKNTPEVHNRKIQRIQDQVKQWNREGRKKKMCSARNIAKTLSVRNIDKSKFAQIELDEMEDIIEIDLEKMIVKLEPGIKMGTLTRKLLPLGVIIPVVPEFESLTVGGLISGFGIATSSHNYGLFASTCLEYKIVLADGSLVTCSETRRPDLFYCIPMSYGTLGFMTSVTFPLVHVGKYVKLEYIPAWNIPEAISLMAKKDNFFIEGFAFSKDTSVIMLGNFTDTHEKNKINYINRWYKNWFYKHAESVLTTKSPMVEYIPTRDYYHRHDRSYYWTTPIPKIMQTKLYIFLFAWIFPVNYSFLKTISLAFPRVLKDSVSKAILVQDFFVPKDKLEESIELAEDTFGVYPMWLCPCKMLKRPGLVRCRGGEDADYIDTALIGIVPGAKLKRLGGHVREGIRSHEQFTIIHEGLQGFYTDSFLSREDFAKMFDRSLYDKLRKDLNCLDAFPDVYEKVSISHRTK